MEKRKNLDAVQTMRTIREELTRELEGMSFEEQQRYIRERVRIRPNKGEGKPDQDAA